MDRRPRRPVAVSQLLYMLPDGSPDPDSPTDCGETCITSVLMTARGLKIAPGCLRQSLGAGRVDGRTTAADLATLLEGLALRPFVETDGDRILASKRMASSHWLITLGYFDGPNELHWVVTYDFGRARVWFMDPWVGRVRSRLWPTFMNQYENEWVAVPDPVGRKRG